MAHRWTDSLAAVAFASTLGLVTIGCEAESEPIVTVNEQDLFVRALARHVCDDATPCCDAAAREVPGDDCRQQMRDLANIEIYLAREDGQELLTNRAGECIQAFSEAQSCDALVLPTRLRTLCPQIFTPIPEGSKNPGEQCSSVSECASPATGERACLTTSLDQPERCAWYVPVSLGEDCTPTNGVVYVCPENLGCRPNTMLGGDRCMELGNLGEACAARDSCGIGLVCAADAMGVHSCVESLEVHQPCLDSPDACPTNHFCDFNQGTCEPMPFLGAGNCTDGNCDAVLDAVCD
ncbi:MAG: hypothetical protein U0271_23005 [Polyangiaceae bacterium]